MAVLVGIFLRGSEEAKGEPLHKSIVEELREKGVRSSHSSQTYPRLRNSRRALLRRYRELFLQPLGCGGVCERGKLVTSEGARVWV